MRERHRYLPALILGLGCVLLGAGNTQQRAMPLAGPLEQLSDTLEGYRGVDRRLSDEERRVAGVSSYLLRGFTRDSLLAFSVYVGYYDRQVQGKTIHSPKNCLPGAGWNVIAAREEPLATASGTVPVNRYMLVNRGQRAVVYYWYQGRGRVESNEYRVKLQLLRDSALRGRTEEALVRVVVPVVNGDESAIALARQVSARLVPEVFQVLPS
ncbi:MAG TPA: EpsI family protein [Gemmatimonadales bacterium]|nr:EpsI family protein [Gemmatimonadales bacterium]